MDKQTVLQALSKLNFNPYDFENIEMENGELKNDDVVKGIIKISQLHDDVKTSSLTIKEFNTGKRDLHYFWINHTQKDLKDIISDFFVILGLDNSSNTIFDSEDINRMSATHGTLRKWTFEDFEIVIGFSNFGSPLLFVNIHEK
jgi:hypothetical protein